MLQINVEKKLDKFFLQVQLEVTSGVTVLLGPSGCGKSTLLKLVAGILQPDRGEVILEEETYFSSGEKRCFNLPVHRRRLGFVFQHPMLFPHLSVRENILYGLPPRDHRRGELVELLQLLRLKGLEERLPRQISGGQAQRVALARALITHPGSLLLDEPFSALDNFIRRRLRHDLLQVMERYDIPVILVTHDLEEAVMLGDRLAVMDEGRILQHGTAGDIFVSPSSRKVARFVGMRNIYEGVIKELVPGDRMVVKGEKFEVDMDYRPLAAGQRVVFGIRPENVLYLRPDRDMAPKENTLEAVIVSVLSQGAFDRLLLRATADDYDLEMLLPHYVVTKRNLIPGQILKVSLPKESLHIVETEERLNLQRDVNHKNVLQGSLHG